MSTPDSCKDSASKSNDNDGICEMNDMLHNMSTADNEDSISICANCGKEGSDVTNTCNKCMMVKYCNAACKKKHRHKHKKDCEEHLRLAAELHDIELFKQPPPKEDCPICFIRLPMYHKGSTYYACCGKIICTGCAYAPRYDNQGNEVDNEKCPFCRTPNSNSDEEIIERKLKRAKAGDANALNDLGVCYSRGFKELPQDDIKALKLWHRAAEIGYATAYYNIGCCYEHGDGVEVDEEKANHYYELGAIQGDSTARYNLGFTEERAGNVDRALKHYMIAVKDGDNDALNKIKELYSNGHASKEDYIKALQVYQSYLGEIKSKQRDEAAAADDQNRYY